MMSNKRALAAAGLVAMLASMRIAAPVAAGDPPANATANSGSSASSGSATAPAIAPQAATPQAATPAATPQGAAPQATAPTAAPSDPKALEIADATMTAMGGTQAWDRTRYIAWNFFGRRQHVWDKSTGDIRIELDSKGGEHYVILMNLNTKQGHAWKAGTEVTAPDELAKLMENGYGMWVNDSYWLLMPYKLRDPGVTLKYKGEQPMTDGRPSDCLELTFAGVGLTPENRYLVYVAHDTHLVEQWEYFAKAADDKPSMQTPWHAWTKHGKIMLSGDRGEHSLQDIAVFDQLPREVFTSPAPVDIKAMAAAQAGAAGHGG